MIQIIYIFSSLLIVVPVWPVFTEKASGSTVDNLNIDKVKAAVIPLPPLSEQRRIAKKIDEVMPLFESETEWENENGDNMINAAVTVETLKVPPGNRLEALKGNRQGQYSVRVNDQWRICFRWEGRDAYDVEIVDYH